MKSTQINEEKMSNDEKDDAIIPTMSNTDSLIRCHIPKPKDISRIILIGKKIIQ